MSDVLDSTIQETIPFIQGRIKLKPSRPWAQNFFTGESPEIF